MAISRHDAPNLHRSRIRWLSLGSFCSAAARRLTAHSKLRRILYARHPLLSATTGRNTGDWTHSTRTHTAMSYRSDRLVEDLRKPKGVKKLACDLAPATAKKPRQYWAFRYTRQEPPRSYGDCPDKSLTRRAESTPVKNRNRRVMFAKARSTK